MVTMEQALQLTNVRVEEHGERPVAFCPYCSQMYTFEDEKGRKLDIPSKCQRCGAPMDMSKVAEFEDAQTRITTTIREIRRPVRHTQVREAVASKGR